MKRRKETCTIAICLTARAYWKVFLCVGNMLPQKHIFSASLHSVEILIFHYFGLRRVRAKLLCLRHHHPIQKSFQSELLQIEKAPA